MRKNTIPIDSSDHLYSHIGSLIKANKCFIVRIGGMPNHVHILINLHQDIALSALVREIKAKTSRFLSNHPQFPKFHGWGEGYYAATLSFGHIDAVKHYIDNQHTHHGAVSFDDELHRLVSVNGMSLHPDDYK